MLLNSVKIDYLFSNQDLKIDIVVPQQGTIVNNSGTIVNNSGTTDPKVIILDNDILYTTEGLVLKGFNPLLVHECEVEFPMARDLEKDFYMRTDILQRLDKEHFPLRSHESLYLPEVFIEKDTDYNYIKKFKVSMIASAPCRMPSLKDVGLNPEFPLDREDCRKPGVVDKKIFAKKEDLNITGYKLEQIFQTALVYGHDSVILPAFGCTFHQNPPYDISLLLNILIEKYPIKYIFICIKETPRTATTLKIFRDTF